MCRKETKNKNNTRDTQKHPKNQTSRTKRFQRKRTIRKYLTTHHKPTINHNKTYLENV